MPSESDLAWCAGFYEGEGTVVYGASHRGPLRLKVSSTDRDVLVLLAQRSGVGVVTGPYKPRGFGVKPFFQWAATGRHAADLLRAMGPWLGDRRRARAEEKVALWESRPLAPPKVPPSMRRRILARRAEGATYKAIAVEAGISIARVHQICRATTPADVRRNAECLDH